MVWVNESEDGTLELRWNGRLEQDLQKTMGLFAGGTDFSFKLDGTRWNF
jgi:hypothetical protein